MKTLAALLLPLLLAVPAARADDGATHEDIVREIREGRSGRGPDRFLLNVKPISFVVGQTLGKHAPFPMKCVQLKARLFGPVGLQVEPVFVVGGHGGFGFTVGPSYFPAYAWDDVHIGPKYEFDYINRMGGYHGLMVEMDRHRLFHRLVLTYGGAIGFGVTGTRVAEDFEGNKRILEVEQGLTYDVNLGVGFAL